MGRFASAFAFLFVLVVVLGSAGCGQRFERGAGEAPTQIELASQALEALEQAGSAHVVLDARGSAVAGTTMELGIHFEGDASRSRLVGDGEVSFPGGTLGARLSIDEHDLYVRFAGAWYHAGSGIADALADASAEEPELYADFDTPAELGQRFDELFEGEIGEGPVLDGAATWKFEGNLDADAFARYTERYDDVHLTANDRELLGKVAAGSRFVLVVGKDDRLPRELELALSPPAGLDFDSPELQSSSEGDLTIRLELSDFGKEVDFNAPTDARPLDELVQHLFGGFE